LANLIICIKSEESYNRIWNSLKSSPDLEIDEITEDLSKLQENIAVKHYDIAVVDHKLSWKDTALDLFNKKDIKIVLFKGNFENTINEIQTLSSKMEEVKTPLDKKQNIPKMKIPDKYAKYAGKDKKENTPIYKEVYKGIENKLIVICGLSRKAGSTFLSVNLAKALSDLKIRTSVIEPPTSPPYLFYYTNMDKKLNTLGPEYGFYSYPHVIDQGIKPLRDMETILDDIIWVMADPKRKQIEKWDSLKMMKLVYVSKKAPITIIDAGTYLTHESMEPILSSADIIYAVVNPQPAQIKQNTERLKALLKLKEEKYPVEFIINNYSPGINRKTLAALLKTKPTKFIPAIDSRYIHESNYKYRIPLDHPEVSEQLFKPLSEIIKTIIPLEILKEILNLKSKSDGSILHQVKDKIINLKTFLPRIKF
jgi:hypothetical protein